MIENVLDRPGEAGYVLDMNWVKRAIAVAERQGKNQADLALRVLGKKFRGYLGKVDRGTSQPMLQDVLKIAEDLGVSMDYLLTEDMPWLDPSEKQGIGPDLDRGSESILRVVSAMRLSSDEAIRRLIGSNEPARIVAVQGPFPVSRNEPEGHPPDIDSSDEPPRPKRRVERGA